MIELDPIIIRDQSSTELPRPVLVFRMQDNWDFTKLKVPLKDGDDRTGHSRMGIDITIEGQIASHNGLIRSSEHEMFTSLMQLRSALNVNQSSERFSLGVHQDPDSGLRHYLRDCTTTRFDYDLSDKQLYEYSIRIHASDPEMYFGTP